MLERLPFSMPEFHRVVWVSEEARDYWQPKIDRINEVWPKVERASVPRYRPGGLQSVEPAALPELQRECLGRDLAVAVVGIEGKVPGLFGNAAAPYVPGQPFTYRVYFGAQPKRFVEAWHAGDQAVVGEMLGFPLCCVEFFTEYWQQKGWRDLTYPAMQESHEYTRRPNTNVWLKALGVRPVFHLPCGGDCEKTEQLGGEIHELMIDLDYIDELECLLALSSMPMEWSSLHGVAIVTTPLFKIVYGSDPLPRKVTFRLESDRFPEHSARGKAFPFRTSAHVRTLHLNGFGSLEGMNEGHRFILSTLPRRLAGHVMDLGCGDGTLVRAIQARYPDASVEGIDIQPGLGMPVGDLFEWQVEKDCRLVLLAVQRLTEVDRLKASTLLNTLAEHSQQVLIYSYDGWRPEVDDLIDQHFVLERSHVSPAPFVARLCHP